MFLLSNSLSCPCLRNKPSVPEWNSAASSYTSCDELLLKTKNAYAAVLAQAKQKQDEQARQDSRKAVSYTHLDVYKRQAKAARGHVKKHTHRLAVHFKKHAEMCIRDSLETMCKSCGLYCCFFCFLCCPNLYFAAPYRDIEFPCSVYNRILLRNPSQCCDCCLCSENNNGQ